MKNSSNYVIVGVLVLAVAGLMLLKGGSGGSCPFACPAGQHTAAVDVGQEPKAAIPRLVDLGAGKCIPCKMMKPILDELREEYRGRFDVVFYDVWENTDKAKEYGVNIIPTQIFYDAAGTELFRHEGFYSKEDILGKWNELGIKFDSEKTAE